MYGTTDHPPVSLPRSAAPVLNEEDSQKPPKPNEADCEQA
jgi:hypothetical protein